MPLARHQEFASITGGERELLTGLRFAGVAVGSGSVRNRQ